jgi:undecaprenyl-diphosphatase
MDSLIIFCAKYLILLIPLLAALAFYQASPKHRKAIFVSLVAAVVIAAILDKIAGKLYYDPRPFVTHNFKPLIIHAADNGFPSEHSLFSVTISASLIAYRRRLGLAALAVSLIIGIARVAAHVHSPIDIVGSVVLGAIAGWAGVKLTKWYLKAKTER